MVPLAIIGIIIGMIVSIVPTLLFFESYRWIRHKTTIPIPFLTVLLTSFLCGFSFTLYCIYDATGESGFAGAILSPFMVAGSILSGLILANYYNNKIIIDKLGFNYKVSRVNAGPDKVVVLTVHPFNGGLLEKAGFKDGDILLNLLDPSFKKLLKKLKKGVPVLIDVVEGGNGPSIEDRKIRRIYLKWNRNAESKLESRIY